MANLACSGAHHSSLIAQTDKKECVACSVTTDCKTPQNTHTLWPLHGLHNTAHTPFSPPLPCTSHQPNNHRRISDAELKPFKTRRLSVSCYARTEHIGKEPRLSPAPCHPEQLRPIPPRARLLLRKCRQAHSTTEQHTAHALDLAGREDSGHAYTLARVPSALQLARRKRVPSTRRVSRSCSHATSAPSSRRLRTHPYSS
jgi:hypothetical protein